MTQPASAPTKSRNVPIDSLRGLAIILMVAGHVIGSTSERGIQASDDSLWRIFYQGLEDIRMPLFTVLSGFVYAYRPLSSAFQLPSLIKGKARRLLIPMMTVGTIYFFIQLIVPGTNSKPELSLYWRIFFFGYEHLWFLQAIFLIFLIVAALNAASLLKTRRQWVISLSITGIMFVTISVPEAWNVFSVTGTIQLLPFFLLGYGLHRFAPERNGRYTRAIACCFVLVFTLRLWTLLTGIELTGPGARLLSISVGLLAVTLLILVRERIQIHMLARLGVFAYGIYLLHVFGSAGTRIALNKFGLNNDIFVFTLCMISALAVPVLLELMFARFAPISWSVFGQKPKRKVRRQPAASKFP